MSSSPPFGIGSLRRVLQRRRNVNPSLVHPSHDVASIGVIKLRLQKQKQVLFRTSRAIYQRSESVPVGGMDSILQVPPRRFQSTLQAIREQVKSGIIQADVAQERVAKRLSRLQEALVGYDNSILFQRTEKGASDSGNNDERGASPSGKIEASVVTRETDEESKLVQKDLSETPDTPKLLIPRGLYIYGPVGTGKTMLMDAFFETCRLLSSDIGSDPVHGDGRNRIKRFHFHNFLSQVHTKIHHLKQQDLKTRGRSFSVDTTLMNNPIHKVGIQLASELSVLCLDEFQVTDIADAVILSQLFGVLFQYGTVVVATSNRPPEDLYEGGLNRGYFLPFIDLLKKHCIVCPIASQNDYRRVLASCASYFVTNDTEKSRALVEDVAREIVCTRSAEPQSLQLPVGFKRCLVVNRVYIEDERTIQGNNASSGEKCGRNRLTAMGCFTFEELCDADLGATDYRAIAKAFNIVVLENIPTLDLQGHNRARRFITLIDELYEAKCALLCSTIDATTPTDLLSGQGQSRTDVSPHGIIADIANGNEADAADVMWVDVAQQGGTPVGALASVRELAFAFDRAASRIYEMCSRSWWDRVLNKPN